MSGSQTSGDTQIELVTAADYKKFATGTVVKNTRTDEIIKVTATASGVLTVLRGQGGTSPASMNNLDNLLIIGTAYEEGASVPEAVSFDPSVVTNYTRVWVPQLAKAA